MIINIWTAGRVVEGARLERGCRVTYRGFESHAVHHNLKGNGNNQMEIKLLIETIAGLVVILGILVFILVLPSKIKTKKKIVKITIDEEKKKPKTDLDSLRHIIRDRLSTKKELQDALNLVIKLHGKIPKKLGTRVNPKFDDYMEILVMMCRHTHTDKNIILKFDKELSGLNPDYKTEISETITKGLDSRTI